MRNERYDLSTGSIMDKLLLVALPIMGTQFMQMAYNLANMFWLGRVGSEAVAASGTVGMFLWLSMSLMMFGRMGAEIGVSQNIGKARPEEAARFGQTAILLAVALGLVYMTVMMIFRTSLIGFFQIREAEVIQLAEEYMLIIVAVIPMMFITSAVAGCFNASGNSRLPFMISAVGLLLNVTLDPIFIFTFDMGIRGAATATVIAKLVECSLALFAITRSKSRPFERLGMFTKVQMARLKQIFKWSFPVSMESLLFTLLSMIIARFIASWGSDAMAVQRIGSQIESLSWLICGGFATAVTAFVGQNYGAGKWTRIHKSFRIALMAMMSWGVLITAFMYFGASAMFSIFIPEPNIVEMGEVYLKILATCQILACVEFTTSGCFKGMGLTLPPSLTSVACNALRVPLAYILSQTELGLNGIWWGLVIGAMGRGLSIFIWYMIAVRKMPKTDIDVKKEAVPA